MSDVSPENLITIGSISAADLTPAMRQYQMYKAQYPEAILFFRMGDFYETFYEDARTVSRVLGIALTSRSKGENPVPMAGVPHHAVDGYLQRMIAAGYRVAMCEQVQAPKDAKGVIDRRVTRLMTPGTLTEENLLPIGEENFLSAIILPEKNGSPADENMVVDAGLMDVDEPTAALAWCDLSTGKFLTLVDSVSVCLGELARINPRELLAVEGPDHRPPPAIAQLANARRMTLTVRPAWQAQPHRAAEALRNHYGVAQLNAFGYESPNDPALRAAGLIINYLAETQQAAIGHLPPPQPFDRRRHLIMDGASIKSLELVRSYRLNAVEGSLVGALDETRTPMGARLLKNWILFPLRDGAVINQRLDCTAEFINAPKLLEQCRLLITDIGDVERSCARIALGRVGPRELNALARSIEAVEGIAGILGRQTPPMSVYDSLRSYLDAVIPVAGKIRSHIVDDPPAHTREGGYIKAAVNSELDSLRAFAGDSRQWLTDYQNNLIKSTGIGNLKVGFNKVFGFYIEVSHASAGRMPPEFIRRQTVKNAERYITPELKDYESKALTSRERSIALEADLYQGLVRALAEHVPALQTMARLVAEIDVLMCSAHVTRLRGYCRPVITAQREMRIIDGRHPVLEKLLQEKFVANDLLFESGGAVMQLITGPNMAGKSTYIRQSALITLMAQAGLYVPAKEATIGIVDRIFTRIGASDDLAAGQSTFMVEMVETADILLHASPDALVILDEVGRGTSTLDGLALAWAIAEHLSENIGCRTLFATHYHELTELADSSEKIRNASVLVREWQDQILFMHRIVPGRADKSYGVHVARLAGVPRCVVERARRLMDQLTLQVGRPRPRAAATRASGQVNMFDPLGTQIISQIQSLDLERMSPMQAWEALKAFRELCSKLPAPNQA